MKPAFRPAWWLPGAHLQTVWGPATRGRRLVRFSREVLETLDEDDLILDHLEGPPGSPRLLVLHGLEGSSFSPYVQGLLAQAAARGWRGTAMNFRSCARDPNDPSRMLLNRRTRLYHSGETGDFDFLVRTLSDREPGAKLFAVGVSLGGNVLLKWLGENPTQRRVAAAATISVPYDLAAGSRQLEAPLGRLYVRALLRTLQRKALDVARRFPEAAFQMDIPRTRRARTLWEFDDAATAPLHGFAGATDYYARSSSLGFLSRIEAPTLCISAEDDPFLPSSVLLQARAMASAAIDFVTTPRGGHIGFAAGLAPWKARFWAEESALDWLAQACVR